MSLNRRQIKKRNKKYIKKVLNHIPFKIKRTAFGDGYFILSFQPHSVCWFWLEEFPDWKFGIWLGQGDESGDYRKFEIFGQTIALIDKFKPSRSDLCETDISEFISELYLIQKGEGRWKEYLEETEEEKARMLKVKAVNDVQYTAIYSFIEARNKSVYAMPERVGEREIILELKDGNSKHFSVSPRYRIKCLYTNVMLLDENEEARFEKEKEVFLELVDHMDKMWTPDTLDDYDVDDYIFSAFNQKLEARGAWEKKAKRYNWDNQDYGRHLVEVFDFFKPYKISNEKLKIILAGWHADNYWDNPSIPGMISTVERVYEGQYNTKYAEQLIERLYHKPELAQKWLKER